MALGVLVIRNNLRSSLRMPDSQLKETYFTYSRHGHKKSKHSRTHKIKINKVKLTKLQEERYTGN